MDFLKRTAWIYEKELMLLAIMLVWGPFCRFSPRLSAIGFLRVTNYRKNYLGLLLLLWTLYGISMAILGPDL
ncbi:hypothetical protein QZH47_21645 [Pseudomonas corrugata]